MELKTFKIDSSKHFSESLTWYKEQTNVLKEESHLSYKSNHLET